MPLNYLLKNALGYKFTNSQEKNKDFMQMDDINLFAKNEKRIGDSDTINKNIQ